MILLEIAFLSVSESQGYTEGHESERWNQKDHYALADGALSVFGSGFGGAVAHGAGLAEGRACRQENRGDEKGSAKFHFGPSERMRSASGKKIIIKAKHTISEAMVSHFMRETSNFICMK